MVCLRRDAQDGSDLLTTRYEHDSGGTDRLAASFGGGCMAGYHQGRTIGGLTPASNRALTSSVPRPP